MNTALDPEKINWNQVKRFVAFCLVVLLAGFLISKLFRALFIPICVSAFLTYLLAPIVERLETRSVPRLLSVSILLVATITLFTLLVLKITPPLYSETVSLLQLAPTTYETFVREWLPPVRDFVLSRELMSETEWARLISDSKNLSQLSDRVNQALTTILHTAPQVLGTVVNMVMIPLITFCFLKDYHSLRAKLGALIPRDLVEPCKVFSARVSLAISAVIRGQAMVAAILSVMYVIGFNIIGLQSAFAIGLISGACRIINYLDVIVGGVLSMMVIFADFQGLGQLIAVAAVFLIVQSIDGMLITPRIIGDKVGLHPVMVIVSILSFGDLFGFWGVLLAIPALAVFKVLWLSARPFYLASASYNPKRSPQV